MELSLREPGSAHGWVRPVALLCSCSSSSKTSQDPSSLVVKVCALCIVSTFVMHHFLAMAGLPTWLEPTAPCFVVMWIMAKLRGSVFGSSSYAVGVFSVSAVNGTGWVYRPSPKHKDGHLVALKITYFWSTKRTPISENNNKNICDNNTDFSLLLAPTSSSLLTPELNTNARQKLRQQSWHIWF